MDFAEAFKALEEGRRIRRRRWDSDVYLAIQDGRLCYRLWDSFLGDWFSEEARLYGHDLMAKDWEITND
jgi:hypothetical protein